MMRLEWKVFISSKPCRLIVVPRQEFIKHMFGKLLFFFVFPKLGISYKAKKMPYTAKSLHMTSSLFPVSYKRPLCRISDPYTKCLHVSTASSKLSLLPVPL